MPNGFINVYKPENMTSHDVVAIIRRRLPKKTKVGHTGTLDPDATGVLPVCVGKATRLAEYFSDLPKVYLGEMTLGAVTSTQDSSGEILAKAKPEDLAAITESQVAEVIRNFVGDIKQIPPMVSAVKINGKKLYELAREGKIVERKPRNVKIYSIEIINMALPKVTLKVTCSSGTYIRTLINDIGEKLGIGAFMSALERQAVGSFTLQNSLPLEQIKNMLEADDYSCFLPLEYGLENLPVLTLHDNFSYENVLHGRNVKLNKKTEAGIYKVFYCNKIIAVAEVGTDGYYLKMKKVLISENEI